MIRKITIEFITGCICSPIGFICFGILHDLLYTKCGIESFFGGDKAGGFSGIFLGVPIAALIGISLVDKLVFKLKGYNVLGLVVGFILSQLGIVLGLFLIDKVGNGTIPLGLFITVLLCLIGYNSVLLLKKRKKCDSLT